MLRSDGTREVRQVTVLDLYCAVQYLAVCTLGCLGLKDAVYSVNAMWDRHLFHFGRHVHLILLNRMQQRSSCDGTVPLRPGICNRNNRDSFRECVVTETWPATSGRNLRNEA